MKNNENKIIKTSKKVTKVITDSAKIGVAVVAALATAELGYLGMNMFENDVELTKNCIKHKIDPEPIYVKKGMFGKKEVKTINPVTGNIEKYNGKKMPKTNKIYKIK